MGMNTTGNTPRLLQGNVSAKMVGQKAPAISNMSQIPQVPQMECLGCKAKMPAQKMQSHMSKCQGQSSAPDGQF